MMCQQSNQFKGVLSLEDSPERIENEISKAKTDSNFQVTIDPKRKEVFNLI